MGSRFHWGPQGDGPQVEAAERKVLGGVCGGKGVASVLVSGAGRPPEQEEGKGGGACRPQGRAGEPGRLSGASRQGHVVGPSLQTDPPQEPSRAPSRRRQHVVG